MVHRAGGSGVRGLKRVREAHGAQAIGALATPHSTLEELYLLGRLTRGIGSGNVDFRLRQSDFCGRRAGRLASLAGDERSRSSTGSIACWWSAVSCARTIR